MVCLCTELGTCAELPNRCAALALFDRAAELTGFTAEAEVIGESGRNPRLTSLLRCFTHTISP